MEILEAWLILIDMRSWYTQILRRAQAGYVCAAEKLGASRNWRRHHKNEALRFENHIMGWCSCWKRRFIGRLIQQSFTVFLCAKCLTLSSRSDERGDSLQLVKWFRKNLNLGVLEKSLSTWVTLKVKPSWWICVLGWRGSHSFSCSWPKHKMKEKHSYF